MRKISMIAMAVLMFVGSGVMAQKARMYIPWENGKLQASDEGRYLRHESGTLFFWLGETGWLMPERLSRDEVNYCLQKCKEADYSMVQVQVLNSAPSHNTYGKSSNPGGRNFKNIDKKGEHGYWDYMDYIIRTAASKGIYIGTVCIWGSPVGVGLTNEKEVVAHGEFLVNRCKGDPNIIWIIGGDIRGDEKTEVWDALARSIRQQDKDHLMTFHLRGRTTPAAWFNDREWPDLNIFQSGHRCYGQRRGDGDYPIKENTEEDDWRSVGASTLNPLKPVIDDEPIYENVPQRLHDPNETRWNEYDVRRYVYWSVFVGSFGHSYGHNDIVQFIRPDVLGSFGADGMKKAWRDALEDLGFHQMKYLEYLMLAFPFFRRIPNQSIIAGANGKRYDRAIVTRSNDYLLVYNYSGRSMQIDSSKISGGKKKVWRMSAAMGKLEHLGEFDSKIISFQHDSGYMSGNDQALIAIDTSKEYVKKEWKELPEKHRYEH